MNKPHQHGRYSALWGLTEGQRLLYSAAIVVMFAGTSFTYAMPLIVKWCIDGIDTGEFAIPTSIPALAGASHETYLIAGAFALIGFTAIGGLLTYFRSRWAAIASQSITQRIRDRLYTHLEHLPARFHDSAKTGDLIQRCSSDVETLRTFLAGQIIEMGRTLIMIIVVTPILFWMNFKLALVSLTMLPLIFYFATRYFIVVKDLFLLRDEAESAMSSRLQENMTGIRVVRAFARQDFEIKEFADRNRAYRDHDQRLNTAMALYWSFSDILAGIQMGLVLLVGAHSLMQQEISVGTLFAFYSYIGMVIWPIRQLGRTLQDIGKAVVSLGRLNHILEEPEESDDEPAPGKPIIGDIVIKDLTFGYDTPVLKHIDLHIHQGETLAILGPPGCGKSTLIQLLLRLYDYRQGSIKIDGMELSELPRKMVRRAMGVVMQEPFLYSKSIRDNLYVGKGDATDQDLETALADAAMSEGLDKFKNGIESMVGERGVALSGGQRQRVALARALLRQPAILMLDDALSAVDTGTEQRILQSLARRKGLATTIIVTHRLSTVSIADRIVILDDGHIVQSGTHDQLLAEDGPYKRLHNLQTAFESSLDDDLQLAEVRDD